MDKHMHLVTEDGYLSLDQCNIIDGQVSIRVKNNVHLTLVHSLADAQCARIELYGEPGAQIIFNQTNQIPCAGLTFVCYLQKDAHFSMRGNYQDAINLELNVMLQEQGAQADIFLSIKTAATNSTSFSTKQIHEAPQTKSSLCLKGLLKDSAHSKHEGLIHIGTHAKHAQAELESRYMVLGDKVQAYSMPSLEALTDEVQCAHASAIGRFEENEVFYLMSRGLSGDDVEGVLAEAFFNS